jgi:polyphenol oxidase
MSHLLTSTTLAAYPLTCVFTGKPASYGGPGVDASIHWAQRYALCEELDLPADKLRMPDQVHGCAIAGLDQPDWANTDAVIVDTPGIPVACQYADCVPVVLYAPSRHIGAVIHAGWRGTAQAITRLTVERLYTHYGVAPDDIRAVIGPAIGGCCFEVGPEVVDALAHTLVPGQKAQPALEQATDGKTATLEREETLSITTCVTGTGVNGNPMIDVKRVNDYQLRQAGVSHIEVLAPCTQCDVQHFWSHRRGETGRQLALICLN